MTLPADSPISEEGWGLKLWDAIAEWHNALALDRDLSEPRRKVNAVVHDALRAAARSPVAEADAELPWKTEDEKRAARWLAEGIYASLTHNSVSDALASSGASVLHPPKEIPQLDGLTWNSIHSHLIDAVAQRLIDLTGPAEIYGIHRMMSLLSGNAVTHIVSELPDGPHRAPPEVQSPPKAAEPAQACGDEAHKAVAAFAKHYNTEQPVPPSAILSDERRQLYRERIVQLLVQDIRNILIPLDECAALIDSDEQNVALMALLWQIAALALDGLDRLTDWDHADVYHNLAAIHDLCATLGETRRG